jgi:predicted Zn-dependent peptidase
MDVLTDMMLAPLFREDDIEKERSVVLEEIKMDEDNPEYLVHEMFAQNFWPEHAMGRPILGSKETLATFGHGTLEEFFRGWYVPPQMIVTAAGRLEHERFVQMVSDTLLRLQGKPNGHRDSSPRVQARISTRAKRELEQVHLCVGAPCYPLPHEERFAVAVLNNILGGGMASRLFQNIREREGLAYSVFSDVQAYRDTGALVVYAGTAQETAEKTLQLILKEFERLKREPVTAEELQRARDNFKASLMFSMESTGARMSNLARQEIYLGRFLGFDELLAKIDAVTPERIQAAAREFFQPEKVAVSAVGRLDGFKVSRADLRC